MSHFELPLVFFTIFTQWGVGAIVALTCLMLFEPALAEERLHSGSMRCVAPALFLIVAAGTALSVLHLGSPGGMLRAFSNMGSSWLSREALAFAALNTVLLVWAICFYRCSDNKRLPTKVSLLASAVGIIALLSTGKLYYQMLSHPFWNSPLTFFNFLGTAALLGFVTISILYSLGEGQRNLPGVLVAGIILSVLLMLGVLAGYACGLNQSGNFLKAARHMFGSPLFIAFILFALLLPTGIAAYLYRRSSLNWAAGCILVVLLVGSAICSRILFFWPVMHQQPWF